MFIPVPKMKCLNGKNGSYPRNVDTALSEVLVFKLFGAETATGTVATPPIVITLDIIKHRCSHYFPTGKALSVETFHFQRVEKAFHAGVILATTLCTQAAMPIMPFQQSLVTR